MANGKNTVIVYIDLIHVIEKLTDEQAGQYMKHFLRYVNDLDPVPPNNLIDLVFEPQKQQLKRDLKEWESTREYRSISGRLGGLKSGEARKASALNLKQTEANEASDSILKQTEANEAVIVTDTVTVTDTVIKEKNKRKIYSFIAPSESEVVDYFRENGYKEETAKKMFKSYSVANWVDSKGNKVKNWKQKAINVWFKDENKIINQSTSLYD